MKTILVTGGAGYVGSALVPKLSKIYDNVRVLDTFWFSDKDIFSDLHNVECIEGDIRDNSIMAKSLVDIDHVIHLACISNDPSYDLNPNLAKTINFDCFENIVTTAKEAGVSRFILASSSSVYGIKEEERVTEDLEPSPLTDYSKYKLLCEEILNRHSSQEFVVTSLRPATVCGVARRQRLDVIVNILATHGYINNEIKVFGGDQKRPNIHIEDMCNTYIKLLSAPKVLINKNVYNIGAKNHTVNELSEMVKNILNVSSIKVTETNDNRSYKICSDKIFNELGIKTEFTIEDAVNDLYVSLKESKLTDPLNNSIYYNVKLLKERNIL
ncbi:NAD(P)-dependent oxidoreductase [Bacteriovorax sp. Seq25_V]|uniref:NAD-dependent epimerase/dehydratase family protein n=1 Tax=Bacteriovorax sp. Seq25_V TaxID=1201288 RepID=UPI00038A0479|nr:SDR family oxidoreductase [Bacteriovorax sp. Seq25_V]EQC46806.1 NADH(P)-binding protein, PF13460 family [Bacteriovorax sp. Seq25_V]